MNHEENDVTDVAEVVEGVLSGSVIDLFAIGQQGEAVEEPVDGEAWLVNGHDDGASLTRHSGKNTHTNKNLAILT